MTSIDVSQYRGDEKFKNTILIYNTMEYDTVQMKVTQMQIKLTKMCKIISSYENYTMLHVILLIFSFQGTKHPSPII